VATPGAAATAPVRWSLPFGRRTAATGTELVDELLLVRAYPLVLAVDARTGSLRWSFPGVLLAPDRRRHVAYLADRSMTTMTAADLTSGEPRWSVPLETPTFHWSPDLVDAADDVIVVHDDNGGDVGFADTRTGAIGETGFLRGRPNVLHAADGFVLATDGRTLTAFSVAGRFKGQTAWARPDRGGLVRWAGEDAVILADSRRGRTELTKLDMRSGRLIWRRQYTEQTGPTAGTPPLAGEPATLLQIGAALHAVRVRDGHVAWSVDLGHDEHLGLPNSPRLAVLPGRKLLVATGRRLACLDGITGRTVWTTVHAGTKITDLHATGSQICTAVDQSDGTHVVHGIDAVDGRVRWRYPVSDYDGLSLTCLDDGAVITAADTAYRLARPVLRR
jgi:outer membrane protein assembly factor BamB